MRRPYLATLDSKDTLDQWLSPSTRSQLWQHEFTTNRRSVSITHQNNLLQVHQSPDH